MGFRLGPMALLRRPYLFVSTPQMLWPPLGASCVGMVVFVLARAPELEACLQVACFVALTAFGFENLGTFCRMGAMAPYISAGRWARECDPVNSEPEKPNPKAFTATKEGRAALLRLQ